MDDFAFLLVAVWVVVLVLFLGDMQQPTPQPINQPVWWHSDLDLRTPIGP